MGKQKDLTQYEKGQIDALSEQGVSYSEIARRIGRNKSTISKYFTKSRSINGKKQSGRKEILDQRTKRRIFKLATTESMSCQGIASCLSMDASRWTVLRCLKKNKNVTYAKMKSRPLLKEKYLHKRLDFAKQSIDYGRKWETVLFSDEKNSI